MGFKFFLKDKTSLFSRTANSPAREKMDQPFKSQLARFFAHKKHLIFKAKAL